MLGSLMRWLQRWWLAVLAAGLLVALAFPHLASAYHLEAAGRALDDADRLGGTPAGALGHLEKALAWDGRNAQAYRLLARAYQAREDWIAAVESLTRYTELRPENPLGHVELARLYEAVEAEMADRRFFDLIEALPAAEVEAPDHPIDTPFATPEGPAWHSYVATTTFSLPPTASPRPTLFVHPPGRVTYLLDLPAQPAILRFGLGLDPRAQDWPGDGATFEVFLNGERIFGEHVDKTIARQGWHERAIDLGAWAGQEVALKLAVTPGPAADCSGDWAGWGEPNVLDGRLAQLETLHPEVRAVEEWQRAGVSAAELIEEGNTAFKEHRYDEGARWYTAGARLGSEIDPSVGFRWAICAIMAGRPLPQSLDAAALPVHTLAENTRIEAETLRWVLADAYWNIHYGDPLMIFSSDPTLGIMWWEKPAVAFVQVPESAAYRLAVRAKHSIPGPGSLQIGHNFSPIASFSLSPTWQEFEVTVDLYQGTHIIDVRHINLAQENGEAIVDWIQLQRKPGPEQ